VFVAPPDRHLVVEDGRLRVTRGPRENGFRPAVDPLFRSAARAYGPRVVAVVLSGGLDDGSYGVAMGRRQGGVTGAQDPNEAEAPQMPMNAIRTGRVDHVLPLRDIGPLIGKLVEEPVAAGASSRSTPGEPDVATRGTDLQKNPPPGPPTPF